MAAFPIGLACSALCVVFLFLYFRYEFNQARRKGEHFDADEGILERISRFQADAGVSPWLSPLPLVLIILLINGFAMDLSVWRWQSVWGLYYIRPDKKLEGKETGSCLRR